MRYIRTLCIIIFMLILHPAFPLDENDVRISEAELNKHGFRIVNDKFAVSIQAVTLYDLFEKGSLNNELPAPRKQFYISTGGGDSTGSTIYYYEFTDKNKAELALNFIRPYIWGQEKPSIQHPERIINLDNYVIVISSPAANHFDRLLLEQVIYMPLPDELLVRLLGRVKSDSDIFNSPRGILKAFRDRGNMPLVPSGPCFGESWEIDAEGNIREHFYEVMEIRQDGENLRGFWFPISPDNDTEKAQLARILEDGSRGIKGELPPELISFLNDTYARLSSELVTRNGGNVFISQQGNVALVRRVERGYILIVTSEHWVGTPCPFIIAYFWYR